MKEGEVILLDNVRKLKDEYEGSKNNKFVKILSKHFDYYVNDAFSNSHRKHASVVGITKSLPSYMGFLFEEEIMSLNLFSFFGLFYLPQNYIDIFLSF